MNGLQSLDFSKYLEIGRRRLCLAGEPTCRLAESAFSLARYSVPFMLFRESGHTRQQ